MPICLYIARENELILAFTIRHFSDCVCTSCPFRPRRVQEVWTAAGFLNSGGFLCSRKMLVGQKNKPLTDL